MHACREGDRGEGEAASNGGGGDAVREACKGVGEEERKKGRERGKFAKRSIAPKQARW